MITTDYVSLSASRKDAAAEANGAAPAKWRWIADVLGEMRHLNVAMRARYGMPSTLRDDNSLKE